MRNKDITFCSFFVVCNLTKSDIVVLQFLSTGQCKVVTDCLYCVGEPMNIEWAQATKVLDCVANVLINA